MKPQQIIVIVSLLLVAVAGVGESHAATLSSAISANLTSGAITLGICYTPSSGCTPAPIPENCAPAPPNAPLGSGNCSTSLLSVSTPFMLIAPPRVTQLNGTVTTFQGWSSTTSSSAPSIITTAANLTVTGPPTYNSCNAVSTGAYCFTAIYGLTPIPNPCSDPLHLGWTGGTVGCFFGISNIYLLLLVGVPLVVVIPVAATMKPKRATK